MTPLKPRRPKKGPQEFSRLLKAKFPKDLEDSVVQQRYVKRCDKYLRNFLALFSLKLYFLKNYQNKIRMIHDERRSISQNFENQTNDDISMLK